MKLKPNISLAEFLQAANRCSGEVYYKTTGGDVLNLKSQLSKYLFLAALSADTTLPIADGEVVCDIALDYDVLSPYLTA